MCQNTILFFSIKTKDSSLFIVYNGYENPFRKINDNASSFGVLGAFCRGWKLSRFDSQRAPLTDTTIALP